MIPRCLLWVNCELGGFKQSKTATEHHVIQNHSKCTLSVAHPAAIWKSAPHFNVPCFCQRAVFACAPQGNLQPWCVFLCLLPMLPVPKIVPAASQAAPETHTLADTHPHTTSSTNRMKVSECSLFGQCLVDRRSCFALQTTGD